MLRFLILRCAAWAYYLALLSPRRNSRLANTLQQDMGALDVTVACPASQSRTPVKTFTILDNVFCVPTGENRPCYSPDQGQRDVSSGSTYNHTFLFPPHCPNSWSREHSLVWRWTSGWEVMAISPQGRPRPQWNWQFLTYLLMHKKNIYYLLKSRLLTLSF